VSEFATCDGEDDSCCEGFSCVAGDTNSTCFSRRSAAIEAKDFSHDDKRQMVMNFFNQVYETDIHHDDPDVSITRNVDVLVQKHGHAFASMVEEFERRYHFGFEVVGVWDSKEEDDSEKEDDEEL